MGDHRAARAEGLIKSAVGVVARQRDISAGPDGRQYESSRYKLIVRLENISVLSLVDSLFQMRRSVTGRKNTNAPSGFAWTGRCHIRHLPPGGRQPPTDRGRTKSWSYGAVVSAMPLKSTTSKRPSEHFVPVISSTLSPRRSFVVSSAARIL